jgi:pimeloyl-ACP methyl ester carboxylesterase
MIRFFLRAIVVLVVLAIVAVLAGLSYRTFRQQQNASSFAITTPSGIDEAAFVRIGGIDQWLTIRGEDRNNPVILMLHGGPGSATSMLAPVWRDWEKDFTVVQWDQRGSGRTYGRNGVNERPMTVDRLTRDGIEVAQYLITRLHKPKIILLGHSWGTELGLLMIKAEPGLFFAYVGTGQVVAKEEKEEVLYARLLAKLKAANDNEGIRKLTALGPPPYRSEADLDVQRAIQMRFETRAEHGLVKRMLPVVLFAPNNSLTDIYDYLQGKNYAGEALYRETLGFDARKFGRHFAVPVFIVDGDCDLTTPPDLARAWFDTIDAPRKGFVLLKGGGHSALITMPDVFHAVLATYVRPLATTDRRP